MAPDAYLILILVAGMFGAMLSNWRRPQARSTRPAAGPRRSMSKMPRQAETAASFKEQPDNSYASQGAVELNREADGHFYADVEINNTPIHILVDTGASGIALSRDDRPQGRPRDIDRHVRCRRAKELAATLRRRIHQARHVRLGKETRMTCRGDSRRRPDVAARPELPPPVRIVEIKGDRMVLR